MASGDIIAALSLLLSGETGANFDVLRTGGFDPRYPVEVSACPETTAALDIEGHTIICGTVSVPENYEAPDGNRIPLSFMVGSARTSNPFPDPVVYLHGGPGGGALDSIAATTEVILAKHRVHRDIVTFDQRASMISSTTVRCYDEIAENIVGLARTLSGSPPPEGAAPVPTESLFVPCIAELYESDADLSQYNTENNARDVRALMSALGYPEYNIFAISYGTRLALEVLRTAPEGVRSVILDGVAPQGVRLYDEVWGPHVDAFDALLAQCAQDADCARAYPDLREKFINLPNAMAENPIPPVRGQPGITPALLYSIMEARTKQSETWVRNLTAYLPRIIYELSEGDPTTFDWYLKTYSASPPPNPVATVQGAAGLTGDERALALAVAQGALSMRQNEQGIAAALTQLKHDLVQADGALRVAEAFDARATEILQAMGRAEAGAAIRDYALFQTREPTKATLNDWVDTHIRGTDNTILSGLIDAMDAEDVARTFQIADDELSPYQKAIQGGLALFIYACQEEFPFNTLENYRRFNSTVPYPIILGGAAEIEGFYGACALFEQAPRESFHTPVSSDVPVLSLGGTNDTQTSWKWSARAAETLASSQVIVFPDSGHGASLFSQCGMDITAKFIIDPGAEIDTACVDELLPDFVMPDAPLQ